MQIKTKSMGCVEIDESQLVTFPKGLYGFEEYKNYALIDSQYNPLIWLQSIEEPGLAFLMIDPFLIEENYEADINDSELEKIEVKDPVDVAVMAIITVPNDGSPVTANLQGPIIINKKKKLCMQAVLDGEKYSTKHNIVEALKRKEKK
jgi:flagellar assembly factor FliW